MVPGGEPEHGVECDKRVNLLNMEGGGLENVQSRETRREERTEDEHEGKDEQPSGQCQRLQIVGGIGGKRLELARDQFIQGLGISNDLQGKVFMSQQELL